MRARCAALRPPGRRRFGRSSSTRCLIKILGYSRIDPDIAYTLADEQTLGPGSVDTALGRFEVASGVKRVVAPFELKGPDTKDLDRIMPGRHKTPVQQAWEYANDAPGAKWVLVSNCVEIRLYGYGRGREAYEVFDADPARRPGRAAPAMGNSRRAEPYGRGDRAAAAGDGRRLQGHYRPAVQGLQRPARKADRLSRPFRRWAETSRSARRSSRRKKFSTAFSSSPSPSGAT